MFLRFDALGGGRHRLRLPLPFQVVEGALRFTWEFKRTTGFAPSGFGCYFVKREGARTKLLAGAYRFQVPPACVRCAFVILMISFPDALHANGCAACTRLPVSKQ